MKIRYLLHNTMILNKLRCVDSYAFKGKARMGMGSFSAHTPIPTPTLPLKWREFADDLA